MTFDQNNFKEIFWIILKNWDFMLFNYFDSVMIIIHSNQRLGLFEFSDSGHMIVKQQLCYNITNTIRSLFLFVHLEGITHVWQPKKKSKVKHVKVNCPTKPNTDLHNGD